MTLAIPKSETKPHKYSRAIRCQLGKQLCQNELFQIAIVYFKCIIKLSYLIELYIYVYQLNELLQSLGSCVKHGLPN